jgi:hypothetical protein
MPWLNARFELVEATTRTGRSNQRNAGGDVSSGYPTRSGTRRSCRVSPRLGWSPTYEQPLLRSCLDSGYVRNWLR